MALTNITCALSCDALWARIDSSSLDNAVAVWNGDRGMFELANLRLTEDMAQAWRLQWDVENDTLQLVKDAPATALCAAISGEGQQIVIEGDDVGFLGIGQRTDAGTRDAMLESERSGAVVTTGLIRGTFGFGDQPSSGVFSETTQIGTSSIPNINTRNLTGAYVVLRNTTTGEIVTRRVASHGSGTLTLDAAVTGTYQQYAVGACHWRYRTGVLLGRDAVQKQTQALQAFLKCRVADGTGDYWPTRLRVWQAKTSRNYDTIVAATADLELVLTQTLLDDGEILLPGVMGRAFIIELEGVSFDPEWELDLLKIGYIPIGTGGSLM